MTFRNRKGSMLCHCQDCREKHFVQRKEFDRASPPRCTGCGGRLRVGSAYERLVDGMDASAERKVEMKEKTDDKT